MKLILISIFLSSNLFAVSAIYNSSMQVDANNEGQVHFETLQSSQKVELSLQVRKLNTAFISALNSDSAKKLEQTRASEVKVNNLSIVVNNTVASNCDSSDVTASDTLCGVKKCSIAQRVISKCNETDCWIDNPATDRLLTSELSENFNLIDRVDISSCISNNNIGYKHLMKFSVQNQATNILAGGTVQATVFLSESQN